MGCFSVLHSFISTFWPILA